jgi:dTDP-4-dehydrorhamnose 3,5-epimerase
MSSNRVSDIDGVRITRYKSTSDIRGTFIKLHPLSELGNSLDSVALSFNPNLGTLRGLHFQVEPFAEEKLVSCVQGSVFDVIVDLRPGSQTFGKWTSAELSAKNALQVFLPKGIAHGFQTLLPNSVIHYGLSVSHSLESSYAIDPLGDLNIDWPMKVLSISERDSQGISFTSAAQKYAKSLNG